MLGVGFVAYGLSIFFYVYAQRYLGAARTSEYYAGAPFLCTALALMIVRDMPHYDYCIALGLTAIGACLDSKDKPLFKRRGKENGEEK